MIRVLVSEADKPLLTTIHREEVLGEPSKNQCNATVVFDCEFAEMHKQIIDLHNEELKPFKIKIKELQEELDKLKYPF